LVEYKSSIESKTQTIQLDLPFIFQLNIETARFKKLDAFMKQEIHRFAVDYLESKQIDKNDIQDFSLRIENQPEIFIVSIQGSVDKSSFYSLLDESSEIYYHDIFKLPLDEIYTKMLLIKHIVFWNTKLGIYEKFTLQTFKMVDEGKEKWNGMWIGTYDEEPKQLEFSDFFTSVEGAHFEIILIIWESFQIMNVEIDEDRISGRQKVNYINKVVMKHKYISFDDEETSPDDIEYMRQLQEKFDREDSADYKKLLKAYSSDKEAEGYHLGEDDWI